jgi:hypothetical protein
MSNLRSELDSLWSIFTLKVSCAPSGVESLLSRTPLPGAAAAVRRRGSPPVVFPFAAAMSIVELFRAVVLLAVSRVSRDTEGGRAGGRLAAIRQGSRRSTSEMT